MDIKYDIWNKFEISIIKSILEDMTNRGIFSGPYSAMMEHYFDATGATPFTMAKTAPDATKMTRTSTTIPWATAYQCQCRTV